MEEVITITYTIMEEALLIIDKLTESPMPANVSYAVMNNILNIKNASYLIDQERTAWLEQHGEYIKSTNQYKVDFSIENNRKEYEEIMNRKFNVSIQKIDITTISSVLLTPNEISKISFMLYIKENNGSYHMTIQ